MAVGGDGLHNVRDQRFGKVVSDSRQQLQSTVGYVAYEILASARMDQAIFGTVDGENGYVHRSQLGPSVRLGENRSELT